MASFCHLPEDVVQDIFSRVPADSLVRFKRVSKSWYALICSLIKDPRFVAKNLQNFRNKSSSSLVLRRRCSCNGQQQNNCCGRRFSLLTPFVDDDDNNRVSSLIEDLCFPLCGQYRWSDWWAGIHGDGIICLLKRDQGLASEVLLCNPALQEFKLVPGSKNENDFRSGGMGFGYDSKTNTYKLVRILRDYCSEVTAEVHVLGTNSWRRLNVSQRVWILDQWNYLYWKGVCYWQAENYMAETLEWEILCFNMSDEIFYFIPFPHDELDFASFTVWNYSFALFLCIGEKDNPDLASYEMWVMTDYDDIVKGASPWTKQLVIGPLDGFPIPVQFWKSDELLFEDEERLLSYNLHTQNLRDIGIAEWKYYSPIRFTYYIKSLVSVGGRVNTIQKNGED